MAIRRLVPTEVAEARAKAKGSELAVRGIPPSVITPVQQKEILLTMAEALGYYKP